MACTMEFLTSIVISAQRSLPCFLGTTLPPREGRPVSHSTRPQGQGRGGHPRHHVLTLVYDQAMVDLPEATEGSISSKGITSTSTSLGPA